MSAQTENRSGLFYGWSYGENGWNSGMDANLLRMGRFGFHLSAKDRDMGTPPATPASGDTYLVGSAPASGSAWEGRAGQVAVWDGAQWVYAVPRLGWVCYIEDEMKLSVYRDGAWSPGVVL